MTTDANASGWPPGVPGLLVLPSGRLVRGRGLRSGPASPPLPQFGVYLTVRAPRVPWSSVWVRCRDFSVPDADDLSDTLRDALGRAATQRVEVGCGGGRGRTGVALACLAVLDGLAPADALLHVRRHYDPRAVETRSQERFVLGFRAIT